MVTIIDFDNTLSNNDLLVTELRNAFDKTVGKDRTDAFWQKYESFTDHSVLVNFPFISREYWGNELLSKVFRNIDDKAALYQNAVKILEHLKKSGEVYIFTEGDLEFQKAKIDNSELEKYVDGVFIYEHKMEEFRNVLKKFQGKNLVYIDDKTKNLEQAKTIESNIKTVWISQGYYKKEIATDPNKIDIIIYSLEELLNYDL